MYCRLVNAKIRAFDKDLPAHMYRFWYFHCKGKSSCNWTTVAGLIFALLELEFDWSVLDMGTTACM